MNEIDEIGEIDEYILTVDHDYFNENIDISDDIKIVPIRIQKIDNLTREDDEYKKLPTIDAKIKIISIEKNCYCRYILYEI